MGIAKIFPVFPHSPVGTALGVYKYGKSVWHFGSPFCHIATVSVCMFNMWPTYVGYDNNQLNFLELVSTINKSLGYLVKRRTDEHLEYLFWGWVRKLWVRNLCVSGSLDQLEPGAFSPESLLTSPKTRVLDAWLPM